MQKNTENIGLLEDKALVEKWFPSDALASLEAKRRNVPAGYFEQFEINILREIQQTKKVKPIFTISKWGQIAIAASFFTIIATTYLLMEVNNKIEASGYPVSLNDITTSEIDSYINENEELAEIDWQSEITKEGKNLESLNTHLIKDTNTSQ
jgi:hypothetical protein